MFHLPRDTLSPPPEEMKITTYASLAILTTFFFDWILCAHEEVEVVSRIGINAPIVAYYISRLASLCYCIVECLQNVNVVSGTLPVQITKYIFWWASGSATSLLFFFRIRAVYSHSRAVRTLFFALWIVVLIAPSVPAFDHQFSYHTKDQNAGFRYDRNPISLILYATFFCNDTLIFLFISRKIYVDSVTSRTYTGRLKSLIKGEGLYHVSRALLQSGQLYYGVTIGVLVASSLTLFFGWPYSTLIALTYLMLSNAMACQVFRMVLLCEQNAQLNTADIESMFRTVSAARRSIR